MNVPNVNCKIGFYENEDTLSRDPIKQAKYGAARKFYSCNQEDDYLKYVGKGSKQKLDYVEYSGDSEKSTGAFGKNGLLTVKDKQELRQRLRTTKSLIWDCLLTFQPEFGQRYCNEYEQAYDLMKKEFPRFMKDAGFNPDNITWFAGLHTNKKHRHIHISFFENEPTRIRANKKDLQFSNGKIPPPCYSKFKLRAELCLTGVAAELKIARKEVTTLCQNVLFSKENKLKYNAQFQSQMIQLINKLPNEGRLSYDSENMRPLKPIINQLVDLSIKSSKPWHKAFVGFCSEVKKQDDAVREMLIRNHTPKKYWERYLKADTYLEDMYRRMGNQILNYARVYKKKEKPALGRLANKRILQKTVTSVLLKTAQLQAAMEADARYFFKEYLRKLAEAWEENEMEEVNEMQ